MIAPRAIRIRNPHHRRDRIQQRTGDAPRLATGCVLTASAWQSPGTTAKMRKAGPRMQQLVRSQRLFGLGLPAEIFHGYQHDGPRAMSGRVATRPDHHAGAEPTAILRALADDPLPPAVAKGRLLNLPPRAGLYVPGLIENGKSPCRPRPRPHSRISAGPLAPGQDHQVLIPGDDRLLAGRFQDATENFLNLLGASRYPVGPAFIATLRSLRLSKRYTPGHEHDGRVRRNAIQVTLIGASR